MTSSPAPVYHVAPASVRASIEHYGIDPRRFAAAAGPEYAGYTPHDERGFFVFDSLETADWYARYQAVQSPPCPMDIWELTPIQALFPDPGLVLGVDEDLNEGAWFHPGTVPAARLVRTVSTWAH